MKKKIFLFTIFNLSLIFYFTSLFEIRQGQDYKRLLKNQQVSQMTIWPQGWEALTQSQWGGEKSVEALAGFKIWAQNLEKLASPNHKNLLKNLLLELENLRSSSSMRPLEQVSQNYLLEVKNLNDLLLSRRWQNLFNELEQIPAQPGTLETQAILNQLTNASLESNLSQQNKEKILGQIAIVESELMQMSLLQKQFQTWQSSLDQGKKISRLMGATTKDLIGESPFESAHLFYSGALLFLIMNSWIALARVKPSPASVSDRSLSLRDVGLDILEQLTRIYQNSQKNGDVPFRVGKMEEGRVLLSKKMRKIIADDLSVLQKQMGCEGKIQFLHQDDRPTLEVSFVGPSKILQDKIDPTPYCFSTHKKLSAMGGRVGWEAVFDEDAQLKTVEVEYHLPEASQLLSLT